MFSIKDNNNNNNSNNMSIYPDRKTDQMSPQDVVVTADQE